MRSYSSNIVSFAVTYGFIEFRIEFELIFSKLGHVDGSTELTTESLPGGRIQVLPSKVIDTTGLEAVAKAPIELEIRKVFVKLWKRTGRGCLQHGLGGLKVFLRESTTDIQLKTPVSELDEANKRERRDMHMSYNRTYQLQKDLAHALLVTIRLCQFGLCHLNSKLGHALEDIRVFEERKDVAGRPRRVRREVHGR